jgi:hypothetical protein
MEIEPVYGMASCVHSFRPKPLGRLELSKHRPCHVNKRPVLSLYHTILLWCVGLGKKTRNPIPEPGIFKPEPIISGTRILFGNFGYQLMKPEIILGSSGTTCRYPNNPNPEIFSQL